MYVHTHIHIQAHTHMYKHTHTFPQYHTLITGVGSLHDLQGIWPNKYKSFNTSENLTAVSKFIYS